MYNRKWLFIITPIILLGADLGIASRVISLRLTSNSSAKITDLEFAVLVAAYVIVTLVLNLLCTGTFMSTRR
jgi:uncharacterized membrane protein